jgi:predicted amidohydrolase
LKQLRPAFTIIEILVSVIILSLAIVPVLKVHTDNHEQIVYISERNKRALQDSLYLDPTILQQHKETKTAYDILSRTFKINELKSREILKKNQREIYIPEAIRITPLPEEGGPSAIVNEVMLKDKHSSNYYEFTLDGLE